MTNEFKQPTRYLNVPADTQGLLNSAIRDAAQQHIEQTRTMPAPCGCAPKARCDRHCRVRITSRRDEDGDLVWDALCNGVRQVGRCGAAFGDLDRVHDWATAHVTDHRMQTGPMELTAKGEPMELPNVTGQ